MNKLNLSLVIGRFEPFHLCHKEIIDYALNISLYCMVFLGSASDKRTLKNPWLPNEREDMIRSCYSNLENGRLEFRAVPDYFGQNGLWKSDIMLHVNLVETTGTIGLIGCQKDASSFYLTMFPEFEFRGVEPIDQINSTEIRKLYFNNQSGWDTDLHPNVRDYLLNFAKTDDFQQLKNQMENSK